MKHDVKDLKLAKKGKLRIEWANEHMSVLTQIRKDFLKDEPYVPLDRKSGAYNLLANSVEADWDLPYERLALPTLVVTGLKDHIFLEQPDLDNLFARLPKARQISLPDAGHLVPAERPEALPVPTQPLG